MNKRMNIICGMALASSVLALSACGKKGHDDGQLQPAVASGTVLSQRSLSAGDESRRVLEIVDVAVRRENGQEIGFYAVTHQEDFTGNAYLVIARYLQNGDLDTTFGGTATNVNGWGYNLYPGYLEFPNVTSTNALALKYDNASNRLFLLLSSFSAASVICFRGDTGAIDTSWGMLGAMGQRIGAIGFSGIGTAPNIYQVRPAAMEVAPDGSLYIGGTLQHQSNFNTSNSEAVVVLGLNPNGDVKQGFTYNGLAQFGLGVYPVWNGNRAIEIGGMALDNGRIYVAFTDEDSGGVYSMSMTDASPNADFGGPAFSSRVEELGDETDAFGLVLTMDRGGALFQFSEDLTDTAGGRWPYLITRGTSITVEGRYLYVGCSGTNSGLETPYWAVLRFDLLDNGAYAGANFFPDGAFTNDKCDDIVAFPSGKVALSGGNSRAMVLGLDEALNADVQFGLLELPAQQRFSRGTPMRYGVDGSLHAYFLTDPGTGAVALHRAQIAP